MAGSTAFSGGRCRIWFRSWSTINPDRCHLTHLSGSKSLSIVLLPFANVGLQASKSESPRQANLYRCPNDSKGLKTGRDTIDPKGAVEVSV
jgi:hypothetical protein